MKLNHLNLLTSDVAACKAIFSRHFGFAEEGGDADFALLRGSDDFFLVLMKTGHDSPQTYPHAGGGTDGPPRTSFHLGFTLESAGAVRAKHDELSHAGHRPGSVKSFDALGATWTSFYCSIGDGIDIEVNARA